VTPTLYEQIEELSAENTEVPLLVQDLTQERAPNDDTEVRVLVGRLKCWIYSGVTVDAPSMQEGELTFCRGMPFRVVPIAIA